MKFKRSLINQLADDDHRAWVYLMKLAAGAVAAQLLDAADWVLLDTETTGLHDARLVSVAALDPTGEVVLDTLLDPQILIPPDSTAIHGITDEMVIGSPTIYELAPFLKGILHEKRWLVYNLSFDCGVLDDETIRARCHLVPKATSKCLMKLYAQFYGAWSEYHGSFTWQKLVNAADDFDLQVVDPPHSALGDCRRALGVLQGMAAWYHAQGD